MTLLSFISNYYTAALILFFIFGAIIGSFLNVVIYRYPIMLIQEWDAECREHLNQPIPEKLLLFNLCVPRSHCPQCKKQIPFWFNIPIISFILLRGKCAYCHQKISFKYFFVEIISAITTVIVFQHFGLSLQTLEFLLFTYGLIALSVIDFDHQFLPDTITFSLLWLGLIVSTQHILTDPTNAIFGAIAGYLFLWVIAKLYLLIRKKEGMGLGDCKMLAMIGAWIGTTALLNVLLISALLALLVSLILLFSKKMDMNKRIPFGPFIAIAGWFTVFYGQTITLWITRCLQ